MTRHRPTDERKAQILDAARLCFLGGGYQATRVEDIAQAAGLSKGTLYFHFVSKRAILVELVEREFERASEIIAAAEADEGSLMTATTAFLAFLGAPDELRHRFFLLTGELAVHDEELRARLLGHHRAFLERLAKLLLTTKIGGSRIEDPAAVAVLLKAMADGLQGAWALGHQPPLQPLAKALFRLLDGNDSSS